MTFKELTETTNKGVFKDMGIDNTSLNSVEVVNSTDEDEFSILSSQLVDQGYIMSSSSIGYIPDPYDCNSFMGIFVKDKQS